MNAPHYRSRRRKLLRWLVGCCLLLVVGGHGLYAQVEMTTESATEAERWYDERVPLAAPTPRPLDRTHWKSLVEDLDYTERAPERREPQKTAPSEREYSPIAAGGWVTLLKVLALLLGLSALVFLLYQLFGNGTNLFAGNRRLRGGAVQLELEDIEEQLESTDLESYIDRAIREQDYALAIRLYYLDSLKALSAGGVVRWKRDKTNGEYLRELHGHPLREEFRAATRTFERIWYGQAPLDARSFARIEPTFRSLTRAASAATPLP